MSSTIVETSKETAATGFAALADAHRLLIIEALRPGTRCVCELLDDIPISPSLLSYHLRVLRDAGLIEAHRRGRWIDYGLVPDRFTALESIVSAARP